eukprot:30041-Chlamydomonas_euryale.AAC.3
MLSSPPSPPDGGAATNPKHSTKAGAAALSSLFVCLHLRSLCGACTCGACTCGACTCGACTCTGSAEPLRYSRTCNAHARALKRWGRPRPLGTPMHAGDACARWRRPRVTPAGDAL